MSHIGREERERGREKGSKARQWRGMHEEQDAERQAGRERAAGCGA